jgi:hypothetical protein
MKTPILNSNGIRIAHATTLLIAALVAETAMAGEPDSPIDGSVSVGGFVLQPLLPTFVGEPSQQPPTSAPAAPSEQPPAVAGVDLNAEVSAPVMLGLTREGSKATRSFGVLVDPGASGEFQLVPTDDGGLALAGYDGHFGHLGLLVYQSQSTRNPDSHFRFETVSAEGVDSRTPTARVNERGVELSVASFDGRVVIPHTPVSLCGGASPLTVTAGKNTGIANEVVSPLVKGEEPEVQGMNTETLVGIEGHGCIGLNLGPKVGTLEADGGGRAVTAVSLDGLAAASSKGVATREASLAWKNIGGTPIRLTYGFTSSSTLIKPGIQEGWGSGGDAFVSNNQMHSFAVGADF